MFDGGYRPEKSFTKCARVVGEVMGQFHPHGDTSIYDALVRLVQPWSLRYPLALGQGNFGSPGNDGAAAPRYTETKMAPLALEMVRDIDEETVDFRTTTTAGTRSPRPAGRFPNLLVNGSSASPSAWPPTSRRTTCARWPTAPLVPGEPDCQPRGTRSRP